MEKLMENLITNKFYTTKEEIQEKLGVFCAVNLITNEECVTLMKLAEEKYGTTTTENIIAEPTV